MKKLNLTFMSVCSVVLVAIFCTGIYSAFITSLTLRNSIVFDSVGVYYTIAGKAYYEGQSEDPIVSFGYGSDAENFDFSQVAPKSDVVIPLGKDFVFTSSQRKIIYEITITNYTENSINVSLGQDYIIPTDSKLYGVVRNTAISSNFNLQAYTGINPASGTLKFTSELLNIGTGFVEEFGFTVIIVEN